MIYFLGNCQADFISRVMGDRGYDTRYRVQASPLTLPSWDGTIPQTLTDLDLRHGIAPFLHGRSLRNQFQPIPADETPEAIVVSMFHENVPLFLNDAEGYVFFMDTNALTENEQLMEWTQSHCRMFKPKPSNYLNRFADMLLRLRATFPDTPIIVPARLSHYPAFGPDPFSYLDKWGEMCHQTEPFYTAWTSAIDNLHIISMDRVFGSIWRDMGAKIDSLCPFLKIRLEEKNGTITGLHAMRDIEHIGPMPERLADKIETFLKTGIIEYGKDETVLQEWNRPWRPAKLDDSAMLAKLGSGANYQAAEAVASFYLDLQRDHTPLLIQARERMPVCHMTLHMIRIYSRIWPNPDLAVWCDAHIDTARRFTGNGEAYQKTYIERVEGIRDMVLQNA